MKHKTKGLMMLIMILSIVFVIWGTVLHSNVLQEEAKFHDLQDSYWSVDKTTRDAAPADSELNQQLVDIQNYPSELLRLKLIGVGKILTGIFVLLFGILLALMMMPMKLGMVLKGKGGKKR